MSKYTIKNIELPSVTTVLGTLDKPALIPWAVNCAIAYIKENKNDIDVLEKAKKEFRNISKEARDIGSEVHHLIKKHIKAIKDNTKFDTKSESNERVTNAFLAFLEWEQGNIEEWLESELTVNTDRYAGTLDAVAKLKDGRVVIIDFKSSKGFYDNMPLQLSAYQYAYTVTKLSENKPVKIDGQLILRLDKLTGLPEVKDYSKVYEKSLTAFEHLVDFYYTFKKRRLKNNNNV